MGRTIGTYEKRWYIKGCMPIKKRHYIYAHYRKDSGQLFYIGKGTDYSGPRGRHWNFYRSKSLHNRTKLWNNIVAKSDGYTIKILAICQDEEYSFLIEKLLIKYFGRINNKTGILSNMTDGGEGACGTIASEETRKKLSRNASRARSDKWIKAIRIARKNGGNGGVVKLGDKLPESWRKNIAATKGGMRNPMWGRTGKSHPMARAVVDVVSGKEYSTVQIAADSTQIKMKTLYNMLSGHRHNRTTMRFKNAT